MVLAQSTIPMADWAAQNGIKKVVSMVSDFAPGVDAETSFKDQFTKNGGQIIETIRFPLASPDFAPFLQRPGDVTDDDVLNGMGDQVIGTVTAHFYSADHNSPANKAYVEAFKKLNNGMRPNFMAVGGYDGMHLIYEALKKTNGDTTGDKLIAAMKGMKWESPRGPISIDPDTRDIIQNVYIRKVEKKNGELYNVEFATFDAVKDPIKAAKK